MGCAYLFSRPIGVRAGEVIERDGIRVRGRASPMTDSNSTSEDVSNPKPTPNTNSLVLFATPQHSFELPTTPSNSLKLRCSHHL
jgi:hypothetical protein